MSDYYDYNVEDYYEPVDPEDEKEPVDYSGSARVCLV